MPASEVQGPLGLQPIPSHTPTTGSVAYSGPELALGRSHSQPMGEPSQGPSYGRRTQSASSLNVPAPMPLLCTPPAANDAAPGEPDSAPSPAATEIIPPDLTSEEIVTEIQRSGIKVRDFAYEKLIPVEQCAPELFDPVLAWHVYESVLDNHIPKRGPLNARHLRRLLDLGWISEDADGHRWQEQDKKALEQFDTCPHYPWEAFKLTKPKKEELTEVATSRFRWVNADQLVPQFVNRNISRPTAVFRGPRNTAMPYQKRSYATGATETPQDAETSSQFKKRRLSTGAESTASERQPAPSSSATLPLTSVNDIPPRLAPVGDASDGPSGAASLPTAGALTRSLQRHLSMGTISSSCPADDSLSDSRTTFQGTSYE